MQRSLCWTNGQDNFVQETAATLTGGSPSIEHLESITRLQTGFRVYEFDEETSRFLQAILAGNRANYSPPQISRVVPPNKSARTDFFIVGLRSCCFLETRARDEELT